MNTSHAPVFTNAHTSGLVLRFTLALVIFPHGAQMAFGWFGGYGFQGSMAYLTGTEGLPWAIALLVILLQVIGPLLMAAGFAIRWLAIAFAGMFIGMILTSHLNHGFFMNWSGSQKGEGFEYHILAIGLALALAFDGAGNWSLDRMRTIKQAAKTNI